MSRMVVDFDVAMEVVSHEAIVRQAYRNPGDVWTWSVGLTSATGHDVKRYIGKPQSLDHCLRVYVWALDNYADGVRRAFADTPLSKTQFAAALSFHWNTGSIEEATWVKLYKAGKVTAARESFMAWCKPASITKRREAERDLFFDGKWSNTGTTLEYTRVKESGAVAWDSAKRVNVAKELRAALAGRIPASDKVITEVEKVIVPERLEREVERDEKFKRWQWFGAGTLTAVATFAGDHPYVAAGCFAAAVLIGAVALVGGRRLVRRVKGMAEEARA